MMNSEPLRVLTMRVQTDAERLTELEAEFSSAKRMQSSMLPTMDQVILGHRCDYRLRSLGVLSGDYVDYFALGEEHLGFLIADVSGHGAAAALFTVLLKDFSIRLQTQRAVAEHQLSEHMSLFNDELCAAGRHPHIAMMVAVLNVTTQRICLVSAGQMPRPVCRAQGRWQITEGRGKPLGLVPHARYQSHSYDIANDFAMVTFTDGVLELMPRGSLVDRETEVVNLVARHDGRLADICEELQLFSTTVRDDVAALAIHNA